MKRSNRFSLFKKTDFNPRALYVTRGGNFLRGVTPYNPHNALSLGENKRKVRCMNKDKPGFLGVGCTGFTLIELMLVVIIISALAAMVLPRLAGRSEQARIAAAQADVRANISTALKLYELDNGRFPSTSEGLNALLSKSSSATNWNGPYLEKEPIDPWGRPYEYKSPGQYRPQDYDLYSLGNDGKVSDDDVTNWN